MGIHKGYEENNKLNIGIYFKEILWNINKENEIEKIKIMYQIED